MRSRLPADLPITAHMTDTPAPVATSRRTTLNTPVGTDADALEAPSAHRSERSDLHVIRAAGSTDTARADSQASPE
jgi:hypothetical protein